MKPDWHKYSKAKIVLRAHNVENKIWERHLSNSKKSILNFYLSLQNKRLKKFEAEIVKQMDAIVPITDYDKTLFEEMGFKKNIFTCITGVDVNLYQTKVNVPVKPKTVFCFGSMDWMPNQEAVQWFLQNCWPKISEAVNDAKFVIAGRGMPKSFLQLNLPNVLVIENVIDSKAFYEQHEIMLVPLLSGSGLRIKIIEGLAYGKPIVSTSVGAEGIYCINKKDILIADSSEDFSNAVIELLNNTNYRKELEKNASGFAFKEFDNKNVVSKLVQFYKTLLNLRTANAAFKDNAVFERIKVNLPNQVMAYSRKNGDALVVVVLNLSENTNEIKLDATLPSGKSYFEAITHQEFKDIHNISLPAWGYKVFVYGTK